MAGKDGRNCAADFEDSETEARAAHAAWEKRQGTKSRIFGNQAEQEAVPKFFTGSGAEGSAGRMQKLKLAVEA